MSKRSLYWFKSFIWSVILAFFFGCGLAFLLPPFVLCYPQTFRETCEGIVPSIAFVWPPLFTACVVFFDSFNEQQKKIWRRLISACFWGGVSFAYNPLIQIIKTFLYTTGRAVFTGRPDYWRHYLGYLFFSFFIILIYKGHRGRFSIT